MKRSIWNEMRKMQDQMDSMFNGFFDENAFFPETKGLLAYPEHKLIGNNYQRPLSDMYETEKELVAEIEMPGVNKKDIEIQVSDTGIEIKAQTKTQIEKEDKKEGTYYHERSSSDFYRYFSLPQSVDASKANAKYENGVLKINIPKLKLEEQKKKKKLLEVK